MTDSMKFGPEWIRNLSSETFPNASSNAVSKVQLAEKRYSRDEMLYLFDENRLIAPDNLKRHTSLYTEEIQVPLGIQRSSTEKAPVKQELAPPLSSWQTRNYQQLNPMRSRTLTGRNNGTSGPGLTPGPSSVGIMSNRSAIRNSHNSNNPHQTTSSWSNGSGTSSANNHDWTPSDSSPASNSNSGSSSWRHKSYTWRNESDSNSGGGGYSSAIAYNGGTNGIGERVDNGGKNQNHAHSISGSVKWNKWRTNDNMSSLANTENLLKKVSWENENCASDEKISVTSVSSSNHALIETDSLQSKWNTGDKKKTNESLDEEQCFRHKNHNSASLAAFSKNASSLMQQSRSLPAADFMSSSKSKVLSTSASMVLSSSSSVASTSTLTSTSLSSLGTTKVSHSSKPLIRPNEESASEAVRQENLLDSNSNKVALESLLAKSVDLQTDKKTETGQPLSTPNIQNFSDYLDAANLSQNLNSIMNNSANINPLASFSSLHNNFLMQYSQMQQQQQQQQVQNHPLLGAIPPLPPSMIGTKIPPPPPNLNMLQSHLQAGLPMSLAATMLPPPPPSLPLPNSAVAASNVLGSSSLSFASILNDKWYYLDPQNEIQGPFSTIEMNDWYRVGYFSLNLNVRRQNETMFVPLQELVKINPNFPFHATLLKNEQQPLQQKLFTTNSSVDSAAASLSSQTPTSSAVVTETAASTSSSRSFSDSNIPPLSGFPTFSNDFLLDNQLKQLIIEQKQRSELIMLLQQQAMLNTAASGLSSTSAVTNNPLLSSALPSQPLPIPPLNPTNLDQQNKHVSSVESTNFLLSLMKQPQQMPLNPEIVSSLTSLNFLHSEKQWQQPLQEIPTELSNNYNADLISTKNDQKDGEHGSEVTEQNIRNHYTMEKLLYHDEIIPLPPNVVIPKKGKKVESKPETVVAKTETINGTASTKKSKSVEKVATEVNRDSKGKGANSETSSALKVVDKSQEKSAKSSQSKSSKKTNEKSDSKVSQKECVPLMVQSQSKPQSHLPVTVSKTKSKSTTNECKTEKQPSKEQNEKLSHKVVAQAINKESKEKQSVHAKESRIWNEVNKTVLPLHEIQKIEQKTEKKKIGIQKKEALLTQDVNNLDKKTEKPLIGWTKMKSNATTTMAQSKLPTLEEVQAEQKKVQSEIAKVKSSSIASTLASQQNLATATLQENIKKNAWANNVTSKAATTATVWSGGFWDCDSTRTTIATTTASKSASVVTTSKQDVKSKATTAAAAASVSVSTQMKKDRSDFESWCAKVLMHAAGNDSKGVDIVELVKLLIDAESANDTRDYVVNYFGQSKGIQHFLSQFFERKSKFRDKYVGSQSKDSVKNSTRSSTNKPQVANTSSTIKKKSKKKEMKQVEPSLLGIRAVAAENRYNAGDLDFGDDEF